MEKLHAIGAALVVAYHYFLAHIAPWLLATLIPTVIAGLSASPTRKGLVPLVQAVARLLGWATHKDEDGTFKFPLQEIASLVWGWWKARGGAAVFLPFAIGVGLAGMLLSGCATLTPAQRAQGAAYGACMEAKGIALAPQVGQEAWNDLSSGAGKDVIFGQLEGLAGRAGVDAVTCAVEVWLHPAQPATLNPSGVEAAKAFLAKHPKPTTSTVVYPRG